ncbi:MAG: IS1634 family transposase [bacterium]|nr:IS1634 family transposase [bacterium]
MSPYYPETIHQASLSEPVPSVHTQAVGYAPILKFFMERCQLISLINRHVPLDSRRTDLTHGEACVAMITGIFHQVFQLYALQKFATATDILQVILPDIAPDAYFDDRLGDTLDALYTFGLGDLELIITRHMLEEFGITVHSVHNDTTSASVYGTSARHQHADEGMTLTFGYSKKHRPDLKQLIWSLSVSSDSAFPLFQQAYDGNTADVETSLEQWQHLIDLLGHRDFLYVADSKLLSKEHMAFLHQHEGRFLAPVPMYATYKTVFEEALATHASDSLLPYKDRLNRGFEVPCLVTHENDSFEFRMLIFYDASLFARRNQSLTKRLEQTNLALQTLRGTLNRYQLKTRDAIDTACAEILRTYQTSEFVSIRVTNAPRTSYKYTKPGRPAPGDERIEMVTDHFDLTVSHDEQAIEDARYRFGYYALMTNVSQEELSLADAMREQKEQYKSEHTNRRAKSHYCLEPICLQMPKRIEAFLFLFKIVLQLLVLIERTVRQNIASRDRGLDQFLPNRKDVRNPTAESILKEFQYVVTGTITLPDGTSWNFVSELTVLQRELLELLDVPLDSFTVKALFNSG